eukprot:g19540.t1
MGATLATAADPSARREAVEKLNLKTDTTKRDCAKATMVNRYVEVARTWDVPVGSYESLYDYLACSMDNYKTASSSVKEVMLSPVCTMTEAEKTEMHANLKRLKQRGFIARAENSAPVTLVDIIRVNQSGLVGLPELVQMLLRFYCALRPGELCKLAVDYKGKVDKAINATWEGKDLILNFVETSGNGAGIGGAALVQQLAAEVNRDEDVNRAQWAQIAGVADESRPSFEEYKKAVKIIKNKEIWVYAREIAEEPKKARINPAHLVVTMSTTVATVGADPLINRQQRDDFLNKIMTARTSYGDNDAFVIVGEETKVVPELGYEMLRGPFKIESMDEVRFGFRRFPRQQKLGKTRMIDPAVSAGQCSLLDKRVPIPSPVDILASAAVAHDPEARNKNVAQHSRRVIKKCRRAEKRYEEQLLQFFKGEREKIDEDLVKEGASQPVRGRKGLPVQLNEQCEHLQKRRRRAAGEKLDLEVVVVDVAKCYKNIMVKLLHRPYNRLLAYDPHEAVCKWFESITAIFGSKHSVTGWQRQGKFLRSVLRGKYGLTVEDYVDDFPMFVKRGLGKLVVDAVLELLEELGLPAMDEEVNFGVALEVLGLMFSMENGEPEVYLTEEKKAKIKSTCQVALDSGEFELDELETFVGRLTFALTAITDRALSPVMRPLRRMLSREERQIDLSVRASLRAIQSIMDMDIRRRVAFEDPTASNMLLYTDA